MRGQLDENDLRHCYGNFFESTNLKVIDHSYVLKSFATKTRHFDNDTLQMKVLRTWIKIGVANSFLSKYVDENAWKIII